MSNIRMTRTDQEEAVSLLLYAINLQMYGENPLVGSQEDWSERCGLFLRRVAPEPRRNYTAYNETHQSKGNIMSENIENTTQNETPAVTLVPETPEKKFRLSRSTLIKVAAISTAVAGAAAMYVKSIKQNSYEEGFEDGNSDEEFDLLSSIDDLDETPA